MGTKNLCRCMSADGGWVITSHAHLNDISAGQIPRRSVVWIEAP